MPPKQIYFLTGASGAGKSTLAERVKNQQSEISVLQFDSLGVPSVKTMIQEHGSTEDWQKDMTYLWIRKALKLTPPSVLIEGSVNINFIIQAFKKVGFANYKIILINCSQEESQRRLNEERGQGQLANTDMENWRQLLLSQATSGKHLVLDTTHRSISQSFNQLLKILY